MDQYPKLYGENGWTMVYQPEPNVTNRTNGPKLCGAMFGGIADAIANFAKACVNG